MFELKNVCFREAASQYARTSPTTALGRELPYFQFFQAAIGPLLIASTQTIWLYPEIPFPSPILRQCIKQRVDPSGQVLDRVQDLSLWHAIPEYLVWFVGGLVFGTIGVHIGEVRLQPSLAI